MRKGRPIKRQENRPPRHGTGADRLDEMVRRWPGRHEFTFHSKKPRLIVVYDPYNYTGPNALSEGYHGSETEPGGPWDPQRGGYISGKRKMNLSEEIKTENW